VFFDNTVPILISIREREQEQDPRLPIGLVVVAA
jgi:hypothetical protein